MTTTARAEANRQLIESAFAAFIRGDIPAVLRAFDERTLWHVPGRGLANEDRVIVLVTESAERNCRTWSSPQVHAWTIKQGKATVFWQYQGDQQTEDEFWS